MKHETASAWVENFLAKTVEAETPTNLGTWVNFLAKFKL